MARLGVGRRRLPAAPQFTRPGRGRQGDGALQGGKLVSQPGGTPINNPLRAARVPQGAGNGNGGGGNGLQLGNQLQRRVKSGAIDQQQAQRTAQQRQTLTAAYGPDFRQKLEVGGQSFADVNRELKANPGSAKLAALRKRLMENRTRLLTAARQKQAGGEGGQE